MLRMPAWRPLAAVAAMVLLALSAGLFVLSTNSPAEATPIDLVRLHRSVVEGETEALAATSLAQANQMISEQAADAPDVPLEVAGQVKSCCLHNIRGALLTSVLLEYHGQPVTMVVARGGDLRSHGGDPVQVGRRTIMVHEVDGVTMAMTRVGEMMVCVMGDLPAEELAELAAGIDF
jgi:hypothetical protein